MTIATINRSLLRQPPAVPPGAKKLRISDDKLPGFSVEISTTGGATFRFRCGGGPGRTRDIKLGRYPEITPERARELAVMHKGDVLRGTAPAAGRAPQPAVPTFESVVREHYLPHVQATLISHGENEALLRLRVLPAFGHRRMDEITPVHVAQFRRELVDEGLSASRVNAHLAVLRRVFNLAAKWQLYDGRNPAASPGMLRAEGREVFLSAEQLQAVLAALSADEDQVAASAVALLAFTGARKSEILGARWVHVDFQRRTLVVPRSKSGRRRHIYLSDRAVEILERQPRSPGQVFVFPSERRSGQALSGLRSVWARAKEKAGLPADVRLHDLRHTFASLLINNGTHLYDVGRLLGHSQLSTTARYAHLRDDRQLDAVNAVAKMAGFRGGETAKQI